MHTENYTERRTYERYDAERYLLYINEGKVEFVPPGGGETDGAEVVDAAPVAGFSYTGDHESGGTLVRAVEATYPAFVAGLVGLRYTDDDVQALQSNLLATHGDAGGEKHAQYRAEFDEYQAYRTL